ncbi:MAG: hypothetical protein HKN36_13565 [Hellea sp.]|nr:hypothetical protein [Hellea sp.]
MLQIKLDHSSLQSLVAKLVPEYDADSILACYERFFTKVTPNDAAELTIDQIDLIVFV